MLEAIRLGRDASDLAASPQEPQSQALTNSGQPQSENPSNAPRVYPMDKSAE